MSLKNLSTISLLAGLMVLFVACGGAESAPANTVEAPPTLEVANLVDTAEPTAVPATATATATLPPPPTVPPPPAATLIPTSTPVPGVKLLTAEDFGDVYNPLTGEEMEDPELLQRRPIAVKISNSPPSYVRPQSGLNEADIVFEHITEAVATRFTAVFFGKTPENIGPIRSARLIDVELLAMYDAALGYSGSGIGVGQRLFAADFRNRIMRSNTPGYYRTGDTSKPSEHTLYADPEQLWEALEERELNDPPNYNQTRMTFTTEVPENGTPAQQIDIDYKYETVSWQYDPETNLYYRIAADEPHMDANTEEQLQTRNVVVVFANHENDADICEQVSADNICQLLSVEIQLWGQGNAIVFRDGQRFDGVWKREDRKDMLTFYNIDGNPIPLQVGNTWVEIMSTYYRDPIAVYEEIPDADASE
ncbi:MAG: DUF3048 domain-containing protein, partial [Anaerolineales bacterium]|nr:DUF3048 domain-containing protein [Anaerolineales bacterium]